jgi:TonB family protein
VRRPENSRPNQTNNEISRQTNTQRIEETPLEIGKISVTPNTQLARPKGDFKIKIGPESNYINTERGQVNNIASFSNATQTAQVEKPEITIPKPPPIIKKSEPEETKKTTTVSGGVVNGKATSLPKPAYPPPARAVGAGGKVDVQVTIDENGSVVSAKAISGHPLLRNSAERAARSAKFSPTYLSKQPVKVSGLIVYNFTKN